MFFSILSLGIFAAVIFGGLALIDGTGVPSKDNARTGTAGQTLADSLVTPEPLTDSFSGIVGKMLAEYEGEAVIVIDPHTRKVVATTDSAKATALKAAVAAGSGRQITIVPDSGQSGKALAWTATSGASVGSDDAAAATALTAAAKPRRSVESLVSGLIGWIDKPTDPDDSGTAAFVNGAIIVVDQITGNVVVQVPAENARAGLSAALAAVAPSTTDMAAVELSADDGPSDTNPAIFEGGATS